MQVSYFNRKLLQLVCYKIFGFIISAFSLGFYLFWVKIALKKWKVKHTYFIS